MGNPSIQLDMSKSQPAGTGTPPASSGGVQLDMSKSQPTNVNNDAAGAPSQPQQDEPGFFSRAYETSGLKGIVDMGSATLHRPIDLYHQAVDQANKGDWKGASETALKLTGLIPDPDHPLAKAAREIIMHPINEMKESYKQNRKAGYGRAASATNVPNIIEGSKRVKANVSKDVDAGNYAGAVGDVISEPLQSHLAGSVPLLGGAVQQIGGNLNKDLHDHNYSAVAGDAIGPLLTLGVGKVLGALGAAGEAGGEAGLATEGTGAAAEGTGAGAEGTGAATTGVAPPPRPVAPIANDLGPRTVEIAGEKVPVARNNPQFNPAPSRGVRVASKLATKEGAAKFVNDQVQPAAVRATQANFTRSAMTELDKLRAAQGEELTATKPPQINTTDDIVSTLKDEARNTYKKLDAAAQPDIDAWDQKYGPESGYKPPKPSGLVDEKGNPLSSGEPEQIPDRPKTFTELQDQLTEAKRTMKSKLASQVDKQAAKDAIPQYQQEMNDFLTKHKDVVSDGELGQANKVYAQAGRYQFVANKVRTALQGTEEGAQSIAEGKSIRTAALKNLPKVFDNKYGAGEFQKLLGKDGVQNYNDVINALSEPSVGGGFLGWLKELPFGAGKLTSALENPTLGRLADSLLFNPEAGSTALRLYRGAQARAAAMGRLASKGAPAAKAAPVVGPSGQDKGYNAAQDALGGK